MFKKRLSALSVIITCVLSSGCSPQLPFRLAEHRAGNKTYTAPLLYPLTSGRPYVTATVTHTNEKTNQTKSMDIRFLVDTGAHNFLPVGFFDTFGLTRGQKRTTSGASGATHAVSRSQIDRLQIGELTFRNVDVDGGPAKIIGRQVLNALPWTMDLDRGVIIWNDHHGSNLDSKHQPHLKLIRRDRAYHVQARLNQATYNLVFDTGADALYIAKDVVETIGSPSEKLKSEITVEGIFGKTVEKKFFPTDIQLDTLATQRVAAYRKGAESRGALLNDNVSGLLGFPILARYRFTYVPKRYVIFRPRSSLIDTRRARMERWDFVPKTCKSPGCMTHEMSFNKAKDTFKATIHFEAYYRKPIAITIGCLTPEGEVDTNRLLITLSGANASPKKPWEFNYSMKKDTLASLGLRYNESGCEKSVILDINPVTASRFKHNTTWIRLQPSILMDSLKRHDFFQVYKVKKKALAEKKKAERKRKAEKKKAEREKKVEKEGTPTGQLRNSETENDSRTEKNNTGAAPPAK